MVSSRWSRAVRRAVAWCAPAAVGVALWLGTPVPSAAQEPATRATTPVAYLVDRGTVPRPPRHAGRDVGFSVRLRERSYWVFGDTFLPEAAADGLRWRSSSWSWTGDLCAGDGLGPYHHALDDRGLALQLLPHTPEEARFNRAHEGHDACPAQSDCGARTTPWPGALVAGPDGREALLYYLNMHTGPGGPWDFRSVSGSVARWRDPEIPAERVEPPLFADEEPDWGAAALLLDGVVHVYACDYRDGKSPCRLARVVFEEAGERTAYRFWDGEKYVNDWRAAQPVFEGAPLMSIHWNGHLDAFLALYLDGASNRIALRTAPAPEGPWTEAAIVGGTPPPTEGFNYALAAHPEFSREDGRVLLLSYTHPTGFLSQATRLLELTFRRQGPGGPGSTKS